jgi:hypothetical protein
MIKERISALSSKPLPTQEQIDWAIKNKDLKKMMRNYRKGMKKPMGKRRDNVIG